VKKTALLLSFALCALPCLARAQFAWGDLVMSFQATGGQGASQTVAANLGTGYSYRDATGNALNVINLGSLLSSTYGADWHDRTDLYMTINGLYAAGGSPANSGGPVVNGDARNATYIGYTRDNGEAGSYTPFSMTASQVRAAGSQLTTYNATVSNALSSTLAATIATSENSTIEDFTTPNSGGTRLANWVSFNSAALTTFSSGTLFSHNGFDYQGAMTLQRLNAYDGTTGALAGNVVVDGISAGTGSNEGFFAITSSGQVDYYSPVAPVPAPVITITSTSYSANAFSLTWSGTGSLPVTIQRREALASGQWTAIGQQVTTGQFTDPNTPPGQAFYRVVYP
jgi:hypothetical protein